MKRVVLLGTFDTKGAEYAYIAEQITARGLEVILVDMGIYEPQAVTPTIDRNAVAAASGFDSRVLAAKGDRGAAVTAMAQGATVVLRDLYEDGRFDAVFALGGGGGTSMAAHAMRELPVGIPKLILTTIAAGDTKPIIGASDIMLMQAIVDPVGLNRVTCRMFTSAAAALAGMATSDVAEQPSDRPLIAATMFGVTTPCVDAARKRLEAAGFEVLVFHATGTGGATMEKLVRQRAFAGVLDITLTELADELVGGILSAGPERLEAASDTRTPQVVTLGALDMVNFGPRDTVPERFKDRVFYQHNEIVTLMRTTAEECAELGKVIARKLNAAEEGVSLFIPTLGTSMISVQGQPFYDPAADAALIDAVKQNIQDHVEVVEMDAALNDEVFAHQMADRLIAYCS